MFAHVTIFDLAVVGVFSTMLGLVSIQMLGVVLVSVTITDILSVILGSFLPHWGGLFAPAFRLLVRCLPDSWLKGSTHHVEEAFALALLLGSLVAGLVGVLMASIVAKVDSRVGRHSVLLDAAVFSLVQLILVPVYIAVASFPVGVLIALKATNHSGRTTNTTATAAQARASTQEVAAALYIVGWTWLVLYYHANPLQTGVRIPQ